MERQRIAEATKGLGKPKVGGEFDLVNHDGIKFTDMDMKGKYALVSLFLGRIASLPFSPSLHCSRNVNGGSSEVCMLNPKMKPMSKRFYNNEQRSRL